MILGAQLYTVRDQCKTLPDFSETLKKIADIGYSTVQVSGVCEYETEWLRDELKADGLRCVITHIPFDRVRDETDRVIADHTVFGCNCIGLGSGPNFLGGEENMRKVLDLAHTAGKQLHAAGKQLMYHNHCPEFMRDCPGGVTRLQYLADHTAPEELGFTLDTYWVQAGGADVIDWIGRLTGRIPCVHLKDMIPDKFEQHMAPVGSGNLNWDAILPAFETAGAEYALVEQDNCYDEDPFVCLKKSYNFLTAQGLK